MTEGTTVYHLQGREPQDADTEEVEEWRVLAIFWDVRLEDPLRRALNAMSLLDNGPVMEFRLLAYTPQEPAVIPLEVS